MLQEAKAYAATEDELYRQWYARDVARRVGVCDDDDLALPGLTGPRDGLPNRGLSATKVLGPFLALYLSARLFGSAAVRRAYRGGAWLPNDWDVVMHFDDAQDAVGDLLDAFERSSLAFCDRKVCELRLGPLRVKVHRSLDVNMHLRAVAETEIGIFYRFCDAAWQVCPRALEKGPVPPTWVLEPNGPWFCARDEHLNDGHFARTWTFRHVLGGHETAQAWQHELVDAQMAKYEARAADVGVTVRGGAVVDGELAEHVVFPCPVDSNMWVLAKTVYF